MTTQDHYSIQYTCQWFCYHDYYHYHYYYYCCCYHYYLSDIYLYTVNICIYKSILYIYIWSVSGAASSRQKKTPEGILSLLVSWGGSFKVDFRITWYNIIIFYFEVLDLAILGDLFVGWWKRDPVKSVFCELHLSYHQKVTDGRKWEIFFHGLVPL